MASCWALPPTAGRPSASPYLLLPVPPPSAHPVKVPPSLQVTPHPPSPTPWPFASHPVAPAPNPCPTSALQQCTPPATPTKLSTSHASCKGGGYGGGSRRSCAESTGVGYNPRSGRGGILMGSVGGAAAPGTL
ncbi:hypothetical protein E4T56_gene11410 [Termitomyces sp. T112]|nr:hypothetical protein E4T56_gene11410 [Termitomyces sp. T112]